MKRTLIGALIALACIVLFACMPIIFGDSTIIISLMYALAFTATAVAWNIFSGFTGYISLGHATYYGIGAYALAMICQRFAIPSGYLPLLLLPVAGLVTMVLAIPLGWIILRTKLYAFVVITIAILFMMQLLVANVPIFGGSAGVTMAPPDWGADFFDIPFYYTALIILVLAVLVSWLVRRSKFGLDLLAIRDDEARARSLGVPVERYKMLALLISAFLMGMVGGLLLYYINGPTPSVAFTPALDILMALMAFLGGAGTILGPVVGGLFLSIVQQWVDLNYGNVAPGVELVIFGILLLVVVLFLPEGIVPSIHRLWLYWRVTRARQATSDLAAAGPPVDEPVVAESSGEGRNL